MRAVGIEVLKDKLREYVRVAASGEVVLITEGDRVVAELLAPREGKSLFFADAFLAEAVRKGWMSPPSLARSGAPPRSPVASLDVLLDELGRSRGGR